MTKRIDIAAIEQTLIAQGKLIEAGWQGLKAMAVPPNAPAVQVEEMRNAFFAGAQHLYATMMRVFDPGDEPTDADMKRLEMIDAELKAFITDFQNRRLPTEGTA